MTSGEWDEHEDPETSCRFWVHAPTAESEASALMFQGLFRAKYAKQGPPRWESASCTFTMPPAVVALERERDGWALLRRRASLLRTVVDVHEHKWEEWIDSRSGEVGMGWIADSITSADDDGAAS